MGSAAWANLLLLFVGLWWRVPTAWGQRAPCYQCEAYKDTAPQPEPDEEVRRRADVKSLPCHVFNRTYANGEIFLLDCRTQCACQNGTYACSSLCPQEYISPQGSCLHPRLIEVPGQCCRSWLCDTPIANPVPSCQHEVWAWSPCSAPCGVGVSWRSSNLNPMCTRTNETRLCQVRPCDTPLRKASAAAVAAGSDAQHARHHHLRKSHECKATQRVPSPVHLHVGPCRSRKRFRPKYCGSCARFSQCCVPQLSTTLRVQFWCRRGRALDAALAVAASTIGYSELLALVRLGAPLWPTQHFPGSPREMTTSGHITQVDGNKDVQEKEDFEEDDRMGGRLGSYLVALNVQWIMKCRCSENCAGNDHQPTAASHATVPPTNSEGELILHRVHRTTVP